MSTAFALDPLDLDHAAGSELSDAILVRRYLAAREAGDSHAAEAAFAAIHQRHWPMVLAACCRRLADDRHAAEDAAQLVFASLAAEAARLRDPQALVAWLHQGARNACRMHVRAEDRRRHRERLAATELAQEQAMATPAHDPELPELTPALRAHLDDCLDALRADQRLVVIRHLLQADTLSDIARDLGITRPAVAKRLHAGLDTLRRSFARRGVAVSAVGLLGFLSHEAQAATTLAPSAAGALGGSTLANAVTAGQGATVLGAAPVLSLGGGATALVCGGAAAAMALLAGGLWWGIPHAAVPPVQADHASANSHATPVAVAKPAPVQPAALAGIGSGPDLIMTFPAGSELQPWQAVWRDGYFHLVAQRQGNMLLGSIDRDGRWRTDSEISRTALAERLLVGQGGTPLLNIAYAQDLDASLPPLTSWPLPEPARLDGRRAPGLALIELGGGLWACGHRGGQTSAQPDLANASWLTWDTQQQRWLSKQHPAQSRPNGTRQVFRAGMLSHRDEGGCFVWFGTTWQRLPTLMERERVLGMGAGAVLVGTHLERARLLEWRDASWSETWRGHALLLLADGGLLLRDQQGTALRQAKGIAVQHLTAPEGDWRYATWSDAGPSGAVALLPDLADQNGRFRLWRWHGGHSDSLALPRLDGPASERRGVWADERGHTAVWLGASGLYICNGGQGPLRRSEARLPDG